MFFTIFKKGLAQLLEPVNRDIGSVAYPLSWRSVWKHMCSVPWTADLSQVGELVTEG